MFHIGIEGFVAGLERAKADEEEGLGRGGTQLTESLWDSELLGTTDDTPLSLRQFKLTRHNNACMHASAACRQGPTLAVKDGREKRRKRKKEKKERKLERKRIT